jgi:hypothetical protein
VCQIPGLKRPTISMGTDGSPGLKGKRVIGTECQVSPEKTIMCDRCWWLASISFALTIMICRSRIVELLHSKDSANTEYSESDENICKVREQCFDIKERDKKGGYLDESFVNEGKGIVRKNDKKQPHRRRERTTHWGFENTARGDGKEKRKETIRDIAPLGCPISSCKFYKALYSFFPLVFPKVRQTRCRNVSICIAFACSKGAKEERIVRR